MYAKDRHIYIAISKSAPDMSLSLLQDCLLDIGDRMRSSKLKVNSDLEQNYIEKHFPPKLLGHKITPTDLARNLGVVFDGGLSFRTHISLVCRS